MQDRRAANRDNRENGALVATSWEYASVSSVKRVSKWGSISISISRSPMPSGDEDPSIDVAEGLLKGVQYYSIIMPVGHTYDVQSNKVI